MSTHGLSCASCPAPVTSPRVLGVNRRDLTEGAGIPPDTGNAQPLARPSARSLSNPAPVSRWTVGSDPSGFRASEGPDDGPPTFVRSTGIVR